MKVKQVFVLNRLFQAKLLVLSAPDVELWPNKRKKGSALTRLSFAIVILSVVICTEGVAKGATLFSGVTQNQNFVTKLESMNAPWVECVFVFDPAPKGDMKHLFLRRNQILNGNIEVPALRGASRPNYEWNDKSIFPEIGKTKVVAQFFSHPGTHISDSFLRNRITCVLKNRIESPSPNSSALSSGGEWRVVDVRNKNASPILSNTVSPHISINEILQNPDNNQAEVKQSLQSDGVGQSTFYYSPIVLVWLIIAPVFIAIGVGRCGQRPYWFADCLIITAVGGWVPALIFWILICAWCGF